MSGSVARSTSSISVIGSTATTFRPRSTSRLVSFPVPAPRSSTSRTGCPPPAAAASRWPPADRTGVPARMRRPGNRRTGSAACGRRPSVTALPAVGQRQGFPDQLTHRLGLDQEPVVAVDRLHDVKSAAARKQVGQFLLQPQRVEPVGGDPPDDRRHRAGLQRGRHPAPVRGPRRGWTVSR